MRAVNLIPVEARRGAGAPSRSGGLVYGVLALLGVFAVVAVLYGLSARTVAQREAELDSLNQQVARSETQINALDAYSRFAKLSRDRAATVNQIAGQRFDWGDALRELATVVPSNVELVSITASRGAAAAATGAAGAEPTVAPQFKLSGCAGSQAAVALLLARLRAIDGVERVHLENAAKAEAGGSASAGPAGTADCREAEGDTLFSAIVSYGAIGAPSVDAAPSAPASAPANAQGAAEPASQGAEAGVS